MQSLFVAILWTDKEGNLTFPAPELFCLHRTARKPKSQMARKTEWLWTPPLSSLFQVQFRQLASQNLGQTQWRRHATNFSPSSSVLRTLNISIFHRFLFLRCPFYQVLPRGGSHRGEGLLAKERQRLLQHEAPALDGTLGMGEGVRNIVGGSPGGRKDKSERMMTFSKLAKEEKEEKGGDAMDCAAYPSPPPVRRKVKYCRLLFPCHL